VRGTTCVGSGSSGRRSARSNGRDIVILFVLLSHDPAVLSVASTLAAHVVPGGHVLASISIGFGPVLRPTHLWLAIGR